MAIAVKARGFPSPLVGEGGARSAPDEGSLKRTCLDIAFDLQWRAPLKLRLPPLVSRLAQPRVDLFPQQSEVDWLGQQDAWPDQLWCDFSKDAGWFMSAEVSGGL